jgi:hypothetical protein
MRLARMTIRRWMITVLFVAAADHARECVVRTGRTPANLGRKADPNACLSR